MAISVLCTLTGIPPTKVPAPDAIDFDATAES